MTTPEQVLDSFIFGDINNNYNYYEGSHDITFLGNEFLIRDDETGDVTNLAIAIVPGSLTNEEIKQLASEQEWEEEDVD